MANVLIVVYLLIVLALIGVILLQRSEGGGLGMGGNSGGLMAVRGTGNLLTRTTAILATLFFATAIGLTILSGVDRGTSGILDRAADGVGEGTGPINVLDALNAMDDGAEGLAVPETPVPATPAAPAAPAADPGLNVPVTETPAAEAPADAGPASDPALEAPAAPAN